MNPAALAAVHDCTPGFGAWRPQAKRQLVNRVRSCHAVGERALIRSTAILRTRTGIRELTKTDQPKPGADIGTRIYYLNPDNTVATEDDWH